MRLRSLTVLALATTVIGASASVATASQPPAVVAQWTKAEHTFTPASIKWSAVVTSSKIPSLAALQKANKAYASALGTFDTALGKIGFTGKTKSDVATLIKLNKESIPILDHTTGVKSFVSAYSPIISKFVSLNLAGSLSKDLGIPEADIYI